jgi:hypothetical protein
LLGNNISIYEDFTTIDMYVKTDTKHERNGPSYILIESNNEALTIKVDIATTPPNLSYPTLS